MTQLILSIVWMVVYIKYKETYLDFYLKKTHWKIDFEMLSKS
jgi:hypothetical protein